MPLPNNDAQLPEQRLFEIGTLVQFRILDTLLDQGLPRSAVRHLEERGFDVSHVADIGHGLRRRIHRTVGLELVMI